MNEKATTTTKKKKKKIKKTHKKCFNIKCFGLVCFLLFFSLSAAGVPLSPNLFHLGLVFLTGTAVVTNSKKDSHVSIIIIFPTDQPIQL